MMNDTSARVNVFVFLTTALGGRPIYAFIWALWLSIAGFISTGADLLRNQPHSPSTVSACTVSAMAIFSIGLRLGLFLKNKEQRPLLFSIDPRCAAVKVSGFSRVAIMTVPLLGLLAIAAVWFWR